MRHVAIWLAMIIAGAALPAPPAQAQKNEGMGVLGPTRLGGGGPRVNKPRKARRDTCRPANPSGEPVIDRAICANRTLLRKDERVALLFDALKQAADEAKAEQLGAAHEAWLESRKPCADNEKVIVTCLTRLYNSRLRELERLTAEGEPKTEPETPRTPRRRK